MTNQKSTDSSQTESRQHVKTDWKMWVDDSDKYENVVRGSFSVEVKCECGKELKITTVQKQVICQRCGEHWRLNV